MGVRIQPAPALMRVVRDDNLRDVNYPVPPAHCMLGLLACNGAYELGQTLGCNGSGNIVLEADEF